MIDVEDALARVLHAVRPTKTILKPIECASGYALSQTIEAKRTQPPFAASAMDGYAVRHEDLKAEKMLRIIGEAAAGHAFDETVKSGECVRIFTGAPMPEGSDTILIQEDAERQNEAFINALQVPSKGLYVRPQGIDFEENEKLLKAGTPLNFRTLSLAAAMNYPTLPVHAKPKIGILSNGDELILPGTKPRSDQIIASNAFAIVSLVEACGGEAINYGIAKDSEEDILNAIGRAENDQCDALVTLGGASVGDHDLVHPALLSKGADLDFWKIAMRPGKPFMFGRLQNMAILGMPGNPVSSIVCALLFLKPLMLAMQSREPAYHLNRAVFANPVAKNGIRQAYLRGRVEEEGLILKARAFENQDSSLLKTLVEANALIIRPAHAPATQEGDECDIMWL